MRRAKKPAAHPASEDKDFERMYRTIPARHGQRNARANTPTEPERPKKWKRILKKLAIFLLVIALLWGLWVGWKFVSNSAKIFGWDGLMDLFRNTKLEGEDQGRVNILLAGNSADDTGHSGADLTDSIMVVSLNTKDKTGYIMSIPRDLYIDIPGSGYAKINEAYQDGERSSFSQAGYATGGMGLLEKTISEHFGITLHYYALVNYTALREAVNAVGGITINIESNDPRGLYDPSPDLHNNRKPLVDLPNGSVTLDGSTALNLARARGNARGAYGYGLGDFVRTENQRKILIGIKDKATSAGTLSNPVKVGKLFDSLGNNVKTDMNASEVKRLYVLSKEIPSSKITSASLNNANGENLLDSYRTRLGQSALAPAAGLDDYSEIKAYIEGL